MSSLKAKPRAIYQISQEVWDMVAYKTPSIVAGHLANIMNFRIRPEQQAHIDLWKVIFKDDKWLNVATNMGFNLALIGPQLRKRLGAQPDRKGWYLILVSDDKEHKLWREREQLMRSLMPHVIDRIGSEVTFYGDLGLTLNIWQVYEDPDTLPAKMKHLFEYRKGRLETSYLFYQDEAPIVRDVGLEGIVGKGGHATSLTQVKQMCGITLTQPDGGRRQYLFHRRDRVQNRQLMCVAGISLDGPEGWEGYD